MNIAEPFIRRPVMTTLVMVAILLFGILGYRALAVSELPNVDYPTIQIGASLPGASPDTMASAVATPLEKQFSTIAGIDSMTSSSSLGTTSITLQFDLSRNIDGAAQDVQAAIARASSQLPPSMPTPPTYQKVNPADQPILYLAMGSKTLPLYTVDQYAETLMGQRISMVKGVAQVQVYGSQKYAVRIQLDPQALATRQIGIDDVHTAVQNANVNLPVGTLYGEHRAFTLQANGQLTHASLYRPLIVAYRNGSPVRLEDLGKVYDSVQNDRVANWWNDTDSVVLAIRAPARHQHRGSGGRGEAVASAISRHHSAVGADSDSLRRVRINSPFRGGCEIHAVPRHRSGNPGDFPVSQEPVGDRDSQLCAADVHHRHFRRDVSARLHGR